MTLAAIWALLRGPLLKAAPWLIGALLIVASYWYAYRRGAQAQQAFDLTIISAQTQALAQSTANVATLKKAIDTQNADSLARAAAFNAAQAQDAKDVAAANARWESSEKSRAKLADLAAHGMSGCKASAELLNAIGGL